MTLSFEELDYQETALGELILRRRLAFEVDGREIFEVKLNEEYLMSTLFHEAEEQLTHLGLSELAGESWDVVVGGLGLGYTAAAALQYDQLEHLVVVEALAPVIDWHQRGIVPNGKLLSSDARCRYHHADFFALARSDGFDADDPGHLFDAILLDVDHTPQALLNPSHADFYSEEGMVRLRARLKAGGIFGLWSNEEPDEEFLTLLGNVFDEVHGHVVEFENPLQGGTATNGVYVAKLGAA